MRILLWKLLALAAALSVHAQHYPRRPAKREYDTHDYYIVEHRPAEGASISDVAGTLGVEVIEQLGELEDHWVVRTPKPSGDLEVRGFDPVLEAYNALRDVATAQGGLEARSEREVGFSKRLYDSIAFLERQELEEREKRAPPPMRKPPTVAQVKKQYSIEDPYFPQQWHLANDDYPEHMMNVTGLWAEGITGKGVLSGLIDDGLDYTSDDLAANFDEKNSYDFNDHEPLPYPKKDHDHHGTRCAGQIAAVKNKACGIGIAYESKVSGIRILSGRITTADEAVALNYGYQDVSLYSCSWGPRDDGSKMQGPSYIIRKAVLNGINKGRGGKGSVFVFAAGNGGHKGDQCNFDGYTNSIYSVTVAAVDYKGLHPKYSETCTANMVVGYTSGSGNHIVTTDRGKNECATTHGGTSAAAPNVAGVFALALSARPDLTWRDMQYLCVETARQINPHDPDWSKIATGKYYSNKYGFGVIDGWAYVQAAKNWKLVKPQAWFETPTIQVKNGTMDEHKEYEGGEFIDVGGVTSTITITKEMLQEHNLETLEHVNVRVWIDHTRRGDVEVEILSPGGIRSVLAEYRENDEAKSGFPGWQFMTVKHWGENPVGDWKIRVSDQEDSDQEGYFLGWNMILWGTSIDPKKAKLYEIDRHDDLLPPSRNGTITPPRPTIPPADAPSNHDDEATKTHTTLEGKPTANLPHDPTTPTAPANSGSGWLADLSSSKQNWLLGIVGIIILLNVGAAIYFCRRHFGLWGDNSTAYNQLPGGESVPMAAMNGSRTGGAPPGTGRRLYDVVEEEEDENSALVPRAGGATAAGQRTGAGPGRSTGGLGFHSGFLEDDDPMTAAQTAGVAAGGRYKDDDDNGGAGASTAGAAPSAVPPAQASAAPAAPPVGKLLDDSSSEEESEEEESSSEDTNAWADARAK